MAAARRSAEILRTIAKPIASRDNRWAGLEGAFDAARHETIDIVASPEFSHRYRVVGSNYQRVIELLNRDTMELLLREEFYPLSMECSGVCLVVYRKNHRVCAT